MFFFVICSFKLADVKVSFGVGGGGRHFHMGLCLQTGSAKDECDQHLVQRRARGRKSCEYSSEQCFYYIFYDNDNPRGVSIDERQGGGSRRR